MAFKYKILVTLKAIVPNAYKKIKLARDLWKKWFYEILRQWLPQFSRFGPPKGLFYAYDELKAGRLQGEILREAQAEPPLLPGSLRSLAPLTQWGRQPWPIFWTKHQHARLIGKKALLLDHRKRACAEAMYRYHQSGESAYHSLWLSRPISLRGNWTSLLHRWAPASANANYYHWMLDCLPCLALLNRLPSDTQILVPSNLQPFQIETLRYLRLESRIRPLPGTHLLIENFFFSTPTAMTGCANPYAVKFLRGKMLPYAEKTRHSPEKIYIQRRGKTRGIINEPELIAWLEDHGWQVVALETLTVAQQITLFSNARVVCGLHGAAFTNLLWCQPGCIVVELVADNFLNGCYESLASCLEIEHRFLVCSADAESRIHIDLNQLSELLPE